MSSYLINCIEAFVSEQYPRELWEHIQRVRNTALLIAKSENASAESVEVLELAVLLHDIAYSEQSAWVDHAAKSSQMAREKLLEYHMPVSRIDRVCECIQTHSFSSSQRPRLLEAKILFDANSLELMGPVGIIRLCLSTKESEDKSITSMAHKLRAFGQTHHDALFTAKAKSIAKRYWAYEREFLELLEKQLTEN